MLDERSDEIEANVLSDCTYHLHPTFENPVRKFFSPPFVLEEEGWGQFEIKIVCNFLSGVGKITIKHPLQFEDNAYAMDYLVQVPYHTPELRRRLETHFTLQQEIKEVPSRSLTSGPATWVNLIPLLDGDAVAEIVRMIVANPAVQNEILKHPRHEDFFMGLYQLPDELLDKIRAFVSENSES